MAPSDLQVPPTQPHDPRTATVVALELSAHDLMAHRAAGVASWIRDLRSNTVAYSPLVAELFGIPSGAGFSVEQVVARVVPEERALFIDAVRGSMRGRDYRLQIRYIRSDGSVGTCRLTGTCEWVDGQPARVVGTAVDITDEVNARQHQLLLLNMAAEAGQVATWSYDAIERRFVSSDAHAGLYGLADGSDVGSYRRLLAMVHPADRETVEAGMLRTRSGEKRFSVEFRITRPDGMVRWLQSTGTVLHDHAGRMTHMLGITRDITAEIESREEREALLSAEREARDALLEQQRRVGLALQFASIATWTGTGDRYVVRSTESLGMLFDEAWTSERVDLMARLPLIPEPWRAELAGEMSRVFRHGGSYRIEFPLVRRDGSRRWIAEVVQAHLAADGRVDSVIGVTRDMTVKRLLLEEREAALAAERRAREEAEAANRSKSDFLARMSHELRTPLNAIIGFANIVARDTSLGDRSTLLVDRIGSNGRQLLEIINDILDVARVEAGRLTASREPTDAARLAEEVLASLESLHAGRGLTVGIDAPAHARPIDADPDLLRQVLVNLVGNALKFTHAGRVTVHIDTDAAHEVTAIRVADTGIGIPPERLGSIFEAFEQAEGTTRRRYGGTGLGLTIARNLCVLHGWSLTVESTPGAGTTFRIGLRDEPADPGARTAPV